MLTILCSSQTGMQARQTLDRKPPTCDVDLVLDGQLLRLAAPDIGLRFVVGDDQLDRPAVDAARLVDPVNRHLHTDQRGLAAGRAGAGERLQRADLVGLRGRAKGGPPRRGHQHRRADHTGAPAHEPPARQLAAVPEIVVRPILFVPSRGHCETLPVELYLPSGFFPTGCSSFAGGQDAGGAIPHRMSRSGRSAEFDGGGGLPGRFPRVIPAVHASLFALLGSSPLQCGPMRN